MNAVLSNVEIVRLYGKEILIYPFELDNLNGGTTYNLTASKFAYYIQCEENERSSASVKYEYAVNCENQIVIPPNKTILIQTEESIFVGKHICGTYHSKVSLASKGLSHIGTTLDPEYFGTSLIALHNNSSATQYIKVGTTFASLMLYRTGKAVIPRHDNMAGRYDIVPVDEGRLTFICPDVEAKRQKEELTAWREQKFRTNKSILEEKCIQRKKELLSKKMKKRIANWSNAISVILGVVSLFLTVFYLLFGNRIGFNASLLTNGNFFGVIMFIYTVFTLVKDKVVNLIEQHYVVPNKE